MLLQGKGQLKNFLRMNKIVPGGLVQLKRQSLAIKKRLLERNISSRSSLKKSKKFIISIPSTTAGQLQDT